RLLDDTDLTITEIAFAAGFGSVRQFNRTMRSIFRQTPRELRARRRKRDRLAADGGLALRLPTTRQVAYERYLRVLEEEAVPGVESVQDGVYRRTIEIEGAPGVLEITPGDDSHMVARLHLPHWEGLIHHVRRARRIFRLDDHVHGGDDSLCGDGPIDLPGTWDPFEVGVRSILRRTGHGPAPGLATLVEALGTEVHGLDPWGLGWLFPSPRRVALAGLEQLGGDDAEVLRQWGRGMENSDRARIDRAAFEGLAEAEGLPRWLIDDDAARLPGNASSPAFDADARLPDVLDARGIRQDRDVVSGVSGHRDHVGVVTGGEDARERSLRPQRRWADGCRRSYRLERRHPA